MWVVLGALEAGLKRLGELRNLRDVVIWAGEGRVGLGEKEEKGLLAGIMGAVAVEAFLEGVAVLIGRTWEKRSGSPGGGGSGYLGAMLTNACMYSYLTGFTSTDPATKTVSTSYVSGTATSGYAKRGNGFAKITLVD